MASPGNNIFVRLHKWAVRQDENFMTEALALVLEHILILTPDVGTRLVARLTKGFIDLPPEDASGIEIRTQVEAGAGRPDLEIATPHRLVWVEVKVESALRTGQIEGYRILLHERGVAQTQLALLTRYRPVFKPGDEPPEIEVRSFEFADWLENEIPALEPASQVATFLARQFLEFLGVRKMKLAQVSKYLPDGMRTWSNLLNMVFEAASALKVSSKPMADEECIGVWLDRRKYLVFIYYEEPENLYFCTNSKIDTAGAERLAVGEVVPFSSAPGGYIWRQHAELDSEPVHFFARSKISQIEWLEDFLRECLTMVRSIETPDQPPMPEEPGEA